MDTAMGAGADRAIRVTLPETQAEVVGAMLMDRLGPYSQEALMIGAVRPAADSGPSAAEAMEGRPSGRTVLTFYPEVAGLPAASEDEVRALVPAEMAAKGAIEVDSSEVARDWEEGWRDHFHPIVIGAVRIRPPWERADESGDLIDVVINPGLGFGTGLHPTTRGTLRLLQLEHAPQTEGAAAAGGPLDGRLVDAGTGSGILSVAAAKLGWAPVVAFDNDAVALTAAGENVEANGVEATVQLHEADVSSADIAWFEQSTVLANMTLEPVSALLAKLAAGPPAGFRPPRRLVVSGILAGEQERILMDLARTCGFSSRNLVYEAEWVSLELLPVSGEG